MKPYAFCWVLVLVATLALCPLRMQAQAAAEYAITTSAVGTLGTKIGSALGGATKQITQTVQKDIPKPTPPNLDAHPKAAAEKTTEKTTKSGVSTVHIDSTPSGALIFVDNVALGRTPASLTLPKGIHAIEVRHDGYNSWHQTILLSEGENLLLNPALKDPKTSPPIFTVQH
jgi:hypothetical protein